MSFGAVELQFSFCPQERNKPLLTLFIYQSLFKMVFYWDKKAPTVVFPKHLVESKAELESWWQ